MAMNLGYKTKQLIMDGTRNIRMSNSTYDNLIGNDGIPVGIVSRSKNDPAPSVIKEREYLDLGIITDEGVDLSAGGIAMSVPAVGAPSRYNWNVGGRVLRVTLTGIIPDGIYVVKPADGPGVEPSDRLYWVLNGKSNASVFLYKLNKYFAYTSLFTKDAKAKPNTCQYRRYYIDEKSLRSQADLSEIWDDSYSSEIGSYVVTNYHTAFIKGTRHLQYTLTLDFANDAGNLDYDVTDPDSVDSSEPLEGIYPRIEGDM